MFTSFARFTSLTKLESSWAENERQTFLKKVDCSLHYFTGCHSTLTEPRQPAVTWLQMQTLLLLRLPININNIASI